MQFTIVAYMHMYMYNCMPNHKLHTIEQNYHGPPPPPPPPK